MSQNDELLLKVGQTVIELEKRIEKQEETLQSLSKWLTHAFREMGYDFAKIAQIESSRRRDEIANQAVILEGDEVSPEVQDEIARKILLDKTAAQDGDVCPI